MMCRIYDDGSNGDIKGTKTPSSSGGEEELCVVFKHGFTNVCFFCDFFYHLNVFIR